MLFGCPKMAAGTSRRGMRNRQCRNGDDYQSEQVHTSGTERESRAPLALLGLLTGSRVTIRLI